MRRLLRTYIVALQAVALAMVLSLAPANAGCIIGGDVFGGCGTASSPPVPTYIGKVNTGATFPTNAQKYAAVNIGTASNDRLLIIAFTAKGSNPVTSVVLQVAGQTDITMTTNSTVTANGSAGFAYASVGSAYGASADIVINSTGTVFNTFTIAQWTTSIASLTSTTGTFASGNSSASTTASLTVATTSGGFVGAAAINDNLSNTLAISGTETYTQRNTSGVGGVTTDSDASGVATNASSIVTATSSGSGKQAVAALAFR